MKTALHYWLDWHRRHIGIGIGIGIGSTLPGINGKDRVWSYGFIHTQQNLMVSAGNTRNDLQGNCFRYQLLSLTLH